MDSLSPVCSIWVMTSESRIQKSLHAAICRYFTMSCPALLTPCRSHPPPPKPHDPVYVQKPDYGKVPGYLQLGKAKIAEERARANAILLAAEQVHRAPNTCTSTLFSLHSLVVRECLCGLRQCRMQYEDLHLLKDIECLVCNACLSEIGKACIGSERRLMWKVLLLPSCYSPSPWTAISRSTAVTFSPGRLRRRRCP